MGILSVKENLEENIFRDIETVAETELPWEALRDKTILITGAAGFIGYYLVAALLLRNDRYQTNTRVIGMVRNRKRAEERFGKLAGREDFLLVEQDVCEPFVLTEPVSYIIHAASNASAWHFEHVPVDTMNANLSGTIHVLEYARKWNAVVLFISSLKTYGEVTDGSLKLSEDAAGYLDHDSYKNCYAVGKRAAETLCACYHKQYGVSVKIARPSYIYGPASLTDDRVWAQILADVVYGRNILLKSNGAAYRSFCYVSDTAAALFMILLKGGDMQPYNIASETSDVTIRGFARLAAQAFPEKNLTLVFEDPEDEKEPVPQFSGRTPEVLDGTKLYQLGFRPKVGIPEGIRRSVGILTARKTARQTV